MKESQLQSKVLKYIREKHKDIFVWKASDRFIAGIPDIICIYNGKVLGIELKVGYNKPTAIQLATHQKMEDVGAVVVVAYSLDAVQTAIEKFKLFA